MSEIQRLLEDVLSGVEPAGDGWDRTQALIQARRTKRNRARVALAAGAACVAVVLAVRLPFGGDSANTAAAATEVTLHGKVSDAATNGKTLWLATRRGLEVARGNQRLAEITAVTTSVPSPQAMAVGDGSVWTISFFDGTVTRTDAETGEVQARIQLELPTPIAGDRGFFPFDIAAGPDAIWVSTARGYVARIDPSSNKIVDYIAVPPESTGAVTAGTGGAWVAASLDGVATIQSATDDVTLKPIERPNGERLSVGGVVAMDGRLWATGAWSAPREDEVGNSAYEVTGEYGAVEIDPRTGEVVDSLQIPKGYGISASTPRGLWLARPKARTAIFLDGKTGRLSRPVSLMTSGAVVAASNHDLWIARKNADVIVRQPVPSR